MTDMTNTPDAVLVAMAEMLKAQITALTAQRNDVLAEMGRRVAEQYHAEQAQPIITDKKFAALCKSLARDTSVNDHTGAVLHLVLGFGEMTSDLVPMARKAKDDHMNAGCLTMAVKTARDNAFELAMKRLENKLTAEQFAKLNASF
jgi:hypothetical protein